MPGKKLERKGFGKAEPRGLSKVEKKDFPKDELKLQKTYLICRCYLNKLQKQQAYH